jgi:N-acetylmuramoyl-L-alanine amidase-like protein
VTQSPEYPDLRWVPPKSWTNSNRTYVQFIVIHDTEGSSHAESAEDGAAYDARRTDGTSTHYFVDNTSIVQCVRTNDTAHAARAQGNRRGIQYELCARASWSKSKWLDPAYGLPMLKRAAAQVARDCKGWKIPIRKITAAQAAKGEEGILGHGDVTKAFPQDNGDHTDPGPNFPWSEFIEFVKAAAGVAPKPPVKVEYVKIEGDLPVLKQGNDEADIPGDTQHIKRAQAVLSWIGGYDGDIDGDYGPKMAAAVKSMMEDDAKRSSSNGSVFGLPEWRRAFGIW